MPQGAENVTDVLHTPGENVNAPALNKSVGVVIDRTRPARQFDWGSYHADRNFVVKIGYKFLNYVRNFLR